MIDDSTRKTIVFFLLQLVFSLFCIEEVHAEFKKPLNDEIVIPYFMDLIKSHGRAAEWHNVTTEDGFILTVFRLLPNSSDCHQKKRVLFLQHGLAGAADFFIIYGPTQSLAYTLSDAGYDVWLGNFRGNTYSKRHHNFLQDDARFWNFSLDDLALLDLPAMIDYVLKATGQTNLTYVAHSSGCTAVLMLLSDRPEYNQKINLNVMLAPIVFWKFKNPAVSFYTLPFRWVKRILPSAAVQFVPRTMFVRPALDKVCFRSSVPFDVCWSLVDMIAGKDHEQINREIIMKFLDYYPAGTSLKIFYHYIQHIDSGKLRHYDYESRERNVRRYGRAEPPDYNLRKITTQSVIFHALNDPLSTTKDTAVLIAELSNSSMIYEEIRNRKFNHIDFIIAKDAKKFLLDPLVRILRKVHGPQC